MPDEPFRYPRGRRRREEGPRKLPLHLQKLVDLLPLNQPVHQSKVFEGYGRANYARRIRKIISEYGWDIERRRGTKGANDDYYTRRSAASVKPQRIRKEVAPRRRVVIYQRDAWKCRMCGDDVNENQNLTRAQCDHKIPSDRGGSSEDDNLQTLCLRCNLKKRQACGPCTLPSCDPCPYAYPEKFDSIAIVALDRDSAARLRQRSQSLGVPPTEIIARLLAADAASAQTKENDASAGTP